MKPLINKANDETLSDLKSHIKTLIFFREADENSLENLHPDYQPQLQARINNNQKIIMYLIKRFNMLKILKNNITLYTKRKYVKKQPPIGYFYM